MLGPTPISNWLGILLGEKFFDPCIVHESAKKNDKNVFCLNCCITICPHCLPLYSPHRRLQIRRYVYQDVIRLSDAQKLINCSLVQPYTTNSAKVVFLNERPMSRPFRGSGNFCIQCDRNLQDPFLFCSISCKVNYIEIAKPGGKLDPSNELLTFYYKTRTDVSFLELEDDPQMSPCKPLSLVRATNELVKKKNNKVKKRSCILIPQAESISRRKGVPHRSPLN
ncbi:3-ketoacyl-acyl carrier protein synthase III, III isoform 1 [Hibiscus syriacus]|uniref:3-ketoacyl-acyl carrier protein synthase III, III isoform 1 n=1 Tax=Hibiscus syriacus TaxID=106335 RepID=A0A6A3CCM1_HIBSY|nr:uncharacterized protein LOC120201088 [Hibiscus syriacus]KAE8726437.1 3-ketoacyl-acyl carrier protein synthase III, III isoform 1 [Hibiscus syriacus]